MIKRTLEISNQPVRLSVKNGQLILTGYDDERTQLAAVPCEDIGVLLVDECGTTYTHAALVALLEHDAAVVLCGRDHLPAGMLLPLGGNTQIVPRLHAQINAPLPLKKRLWKQVVQSKITQQAAALGEDNHKYKAVRGLIRNVRSGDPTNVEAQAAKVYWPAMFAEMGFRRDPDGDGINSLLNYGYAVMRAAVARAIVSAGLLPALGIHHSNRSNAFCLADDLVEPLRPIVDARVRDLTEPRPSGSGLPLWRTSVSGLHSPIDSKGRIGLNSTTKRALLELLTIEMQTGDQTGPLMVALHRYVASLVKCFEGSAKSLDVPVGVQAACKP